MTQRISIRNGTPDEDGATRLLKASHALMESLFPSESNHYLSIDALKAPEITFKLAENETGIVGCAALANKGDYGEIKSMFVDPAARGQQIGWHLLTALETDAKAQNLDLLRLETGDKLHTAHRLYEAFGFSCRGPFGDYVEDPIAVFMEKRI